jgi:hypothetical protein
MTHGHDRDRYLYLLLALCLQLIADPFLGRSDEADVVRAALSTLTLAAAVYVAGVGSRRLAVVLGLGGFALLGIWYVNIVEPDYALAMISVVSLLAFNLLVIWLLLASLFRARTVTTNTIYGAIAAYMLLGFSFAVLYTFMESFWPGSILVDPMRQPGGDLVASDIVYFSFAVQTTLGFGDVTPVAPHARSFAALQAIMGVFYIAILIARFISMYVAQSSSSKSGVDA